MIRMCTPRLRRINGVRNQNAIAGYSLGTRARGLWISRLHGVRDRYAVRTGTAGTRKER